jgi:ankyrin repeat protein
LTQLLLERGASVFAEDFAKRTPLLVASAIGTVETMRLLVGAGAIVQVANEVRPILPSICASFVCPCIFQLNMPWLVGCSEDELLFTTPKIPWTRANYYLRRKQV